MNFSQITGFSAKLQGSVRIKASGCGTIGANSNRALNRLEAAELHHEKPLSPCSVSVSARAINAVRLAPTPSGLR
jgi:hypothetical protein